ncbi:hypothetical protein PAE2285 [Pyrobaculum aerophilum str. IM2]|uniref:Uncharacterized protein n=2 Tax=Pyrobaculum aerophilum TaxID=13773 RepID=Q8ZVH1_PYRAE|nr:MULTISPECIES: hypothetical protein [Pyrobaculum]AAL64085.1 hypothetical protein PAE2285 [Pyrobaculum aerophilum str. IM2]HII47151.1 hypothetical protein [Pyrobaculum aerophilum]
MRLGLAVLLLLLAYIASAAESLVLTYSIKPDGTIDVAAKIRGVVVNNSPLAVNKSGLVLPPYSAVIIERDVKNVYPPFLRVDPVVEYVNGSYSNGVLQADENTLIVVRLKMYALLPISIPVIITVTADDKIAVLYEEQPTSISQISGSTVYYWSVVVNNYTEFYLAFKIRQFGSFGAVRMPAVVASTALDINDTLVILRREVENINSVENQIKGLATAAAVFSDVAYSQLQNLTRLVQLLNITGTALRQGAVALNASVYALEALRRQIMALGDAARGVAITLNQSRLLVDYQYVALITAANLLEVQSAALTSYSKASADAVRSLENTRAQLYSIRGNLLKARDSLSRIIAEVEAAKRRLSNIALNSSLAQDVVKTSLGLLDSVSAQLYALRDTVDTLISTVDSTISIIDSTVSTLKSLKNSFDELAPLLNKTASYARGNATVLRGEMPAVILNASKNLLAVSQNLYNTGGYVLKLINPIYNATKILDGVGEQLLKSAEELERYRLDQLKTLPKIGLVRSVAENYTQMIEARRKETEARIDLLNKYYAVVNISRVELQYVVELPIAMKNITLPAIKLAEEAPRRNNISLLSIAAIISILGIGAVLGRKLLA